MTERTPFVRPTFARWSIIAFALLLPFVAYSVWDYVETRRLRTRLDAIIARGEPTTTAVYHLPLDPGAEAARYYGAASALVSGYTAEIPPPVWFQITAAEKSGTWPPELIERVRELIAQQAEALALLDRAAALPFDGFRPGTTFNFLVGNLLGAARLCQLRAELRALDGQADAAFGSLYTGVRLMRATNRLLVVPALSGVMRRVRPSPSSASKLASALAEIDRDDRLKLQLVQMRALVLDRGYSPSRSDLGLPPWHVHELNRQLDTFAALIEAAAKPADVRHAAVMAVGEWPVPGIAAELSRKQLEGLVTSVERDAAAIRCARQLIAGEVVNCSP